MSKVRTIPGNVRLLVRDPYWLHAYWEITTAATNRAELRLQELESRVKERQRWIPTCILESNKAADEIS